MKIGLRRVIVAVLAALLCLTATAAVPDSCRKKIAVTLSGGGAKGMAHIGVLRVIERAGIPVDIITGTSIGALIGGLYSIGYDAETLDSLVSVQDWSSLLSDKADTRTQNIADREKQNTYILSRPLSISKRARSSAGGLISGTNLSQLFTRLTVGWHDSIDFAELPIPFACVATDIVDNTEYDFHSGYLSTAMRASMAIPGVFTPVRLGSKVLVDGGLRNNYPADVARRMGADVIIGVSVQSGGRTADDLQGGPDILMQIIDINCKNKYADNWAMTDIKIKVDVKGFSSASFTPTAIDTLIARGERAALEHWDELMALKRSLGLAGDSVVSRGRRPVPSAASLKFAVDSLCFERISDSDRDYVISKYGLIQGDSVSAAQVEQAVTALGTNFLYADAAYSLSRQGGKTVLTLSAKSRRTSRVNLGVRFDTEEMVALQANISHRIEAGMPVNVELTGRLGRRMMARLDAGVVPLHYGKIGFSYIFRHDDISIYDSGERDYNFVYNQHSFNLQALSFNIRNFSCDINVCMDLYDFHDILVGESAEKEQLNNVHLYSYVFNLNYDSENQWFFTTRGARFNAGFGYYTDNMIGWKGNAGISVAHASWRMSFALNRRFVLRPMLYGRVLSGRSIPLIMRNAVGGMFHGQYLEQQMPFAGIGHIEFTDNALVGCQLTAQQRMGDNNYIMARLSYGRHAGRVGRLLSGRPMTGGDVAYYYSSMFGPLGVSLGYSGQTRRAYFYVNLGFRF